MGERGAQLDTHRDREQHGGEGPSQIETGTGNNMGERGAQPDRDRNREQHGGEGRPAR